MNNPSREHSSNGARQGLTHQSPSPVVVSPARFPGFDDDSDDNGLMERLPQAIRRSWFKALVLAILLCAGGVAAGWFAQTPKYTTTAVLKVAMNQTPLLFTTADQNTQSDQVFRENQKALVTSPHIINIALSENQIADIPEIKQQIDQVSWLTSQINANFQGNSEYLHVSMTGENPKSISALVNAVVAAYQKEAVLYESQRRKYRIDSLGELLASKNDELRQKQTAYWNLRSGTASGISQNNPQLKGLLADFESLKKELNNVQIELLKDNVTLNSLQTAAETQANSSDEPGTKDSENPPSDSLIEINDGNYPTDSILESELDFTLESDPEYQELQDTIDRAKHKIKVNLDRMIPEKAAVLNAEHEETIRLAEASMNDRREQVRLFLIQSGTTDQTTFKRPSTIQSEIARLKHEINLGNAQKEEIERRLGVTETSLNKLVHQSNQQNESSVDIELALGEIETLKEMVKDIRLEHERTVTEFNRNDVEAARSGNGDRIQLISSAPIPKKVNHLARIPLTCFAGGIGFVLPILLVLWLDLRKHHISSAADANKHLHTELLGSVPKLPSSRMLNPFGWKGRAKLWEHQLGEAADSIAVMLMHKSETENINAFLVSSAMAGEGKTTLSTHLAVSLAASERKTLLIDFDLRRPSVNGVFGVSLTPGVCEVLRDEIDLDQALRESTTPHLTLLTAGYMRESALKEMSADRLAPFFKELRDRYDFIVVDGSPILPIVDSRVIGQYVDGVILSLLRDVSQLPKVLKAVDILRSFRIPILGTVLTGSTEDSYYYHYSHTAEPPDTTRPRELTNSY